MLSVKSIPHLTLLVLGCLSCLLPPRVRAEDSAEDINALLKAGKEVGWIVAGDADTDDGLAVLFTSRAKGTPPAAFPQLVTGDVRPSDTEALGGFDEVKQVAVDNRTTENIVVSLKEKRVLGRLKTALTGDDELACFPGLNHATLDVLWGPNEGGRHLGVLSYGGKWASREVLLIEIAEDGKHLRQTSLMSVLDAAANAYMTKLLKGSKSRATADQYATSYTPQSVVDAAKPHSAGSPVTVKIAFLGQIPKMDDEIDATMTVLLETSAEKLGAKVLKMEKAAP